MTKTIMLKIEMRYWLNVLKAIHSCKKFTMIEIGTISSSLTLKNLHIFNWWQKMAIVLAKNNCNTWSSIRNWKILQCFHGNSLLVVFCYCVTHGSQVFVALKSGSLSSSWLQSCMQLLKWSVNVVAYYK